MSNKRIIELTAIDSANLAAGDVFAVTDISAQETKKVTATNMAAWIGMSASLSVPTASMANSASFLVYGSNNGTASFAISSSWALQSFSASYVISSSYSVSSSHALTASAFDGTIVGSITSADTASFLVYSANNGSSSFAISASRAVNCNTSSYVQWYGGAIDNGTVYNSISASTSLTASYLMSGAISTTDTASYAKTASFAVTASWLKYTGANNGTASHAMTAASATTAGTVTTITHERLFREYGPITASIFNTNTASFGYTQITKSTATTYNRVIAEVCGDIKINSTSSATQLSYLTLNAYDMVFASADLNLTSASFHYSGSYMSASAVLPTTGSIITNFYLRGVLNGLPTPGRYLWTVKSTPGILFYTASRPVTMQLKLNTDSVSDGQII